MTMSTDATLAVLVFICAVFHSHVLQTWGVSASSTSSTSGDWGPWTDWTTCGNECGPGTQDRTRSCRSHACRAAVEVQVRACQIKICPASQPSFRQKSCSKYDKRSFSGKRYVWEPYVHPTDSCKLSCRAKGISFYANLPERVRDGELCHRPGQVKSVCFRGVCKPVGCDDIILSPARQDKCGVCNGDGSDCKTVSGVLMANNGLPRGINNVITIPPGSTSINITQLSPSQNLLILQGSSGRMYLSAGHDRPTSGTILGAGTKIHYVSKTSVNPRESIVSKGPTNTTLHVKLLSRGSIPNIAYTFSVPIEYDTQALTSGTIQRPVIKTAPVFVKEDDISYSALHGGHKSVQTTEETARETSGNPGSDSKDGANGRGSVSVSSVDLNVGDPDLLEASGDVGVEIIDSGQGGSSVVSSYDVSISRSGVEVLAKGDEDGDDNSDDLNNSYVDDYDDDNDDLSDENDYSEESNDDDEEDDEYEEQDEEEGEDRNGSTGHNSELTNSARTKHKPVVIPRTRTKPLPFPKESMEYDGTHEIDITYFNNDYSYNSNHVSGERSEGNRDEGEDSTYDTTPVAPRTPRPEQTKSRFKLPKFSNSFTFANRFKGPSPPKIKHKPKPEERNRAGVYSGGFDRTRALKSAPTTVRKKSYFEKERERAARERQAMVDRRKETLRKRTEEYNKRLREYQERMRQRRREALERSHRQRQDLNPNSRRQEVRGGNRYRLNIDNVPPSTTVEKSVYVDAKGNVKESPTVVRRLSPSDIRTPYTRISHRDNDGSNQGRRPGIIPGLKGSNPYPIDTSSSSSGVQIIPRTNSADVTTPDNSQDRRNIISRVSESRPSGSDSVSSPQYARKIPPRLSRPDVNTNPSIVTTGNEFEGSRNNGPDRKIIESRRVIRPNPPRYIPNERDTYTSALSGSDPKVLPSRTKDIIPNRVEAPEAVGSRPDGVGPSTRLTTGDDNVQTFSNNEWRISGLTKCTHSCGGGVQQTVVVCVDVTTQAVVTDDNCRLVRRPEVKAVTCNKRPCPARWVPSAWTPCTVTCGDGEQTRSVRCLTRVSPTLNLTMPDTSCQQSETPVQTRNCNPQACSSWTTGNWSQCSSDCGDGVRTRTVQCVGLGQEQLEDRECLSLKPDAQEPCNMGACGKGWFFTPWPEQCPVDCGQGVLTRKVFCASEDGQALPESRCDSTSRPQTTRPCRVDTPCGGTWYTGPWSKCNVTCGAGQRSRDVLCVKTMPGGVYAVVSKENCAGRSKPDEVLGCEESPCTPEWYISSWGQCSTTCDVGYKTREIKCLSPSQHNSDQCPTRIKPKPRQSCNVKPCKVVPKTPGTISSGNTDCKDMFSRCRIAKSARLCKYSYFKKKCCLSCS